MIPGRIDKIGVISCDVFRFKIGAENCRLYTLSPKERHVLNTLRHNYYNVNIE